MLRFVWLLGIVVHTFATQVPVNNPGEWSWQIDNPEDSGKDETQGKRGILDSDGDANSNIEIVDPPNEQRSVSRLRKFFTMISPMIERYYF